MPVLSPLQQELAAGSQGQVGGWRVGEPGVAEDWGRVNEVWSDWPRR